jgi:hypothetical protein
MKKILLIAFLFLSVKLFAQAPTGVPAWNPQNASYRDTSTNLYWFSLGNSLWWRPLQLGDIGPLIAPINSPAFLGTPTTPLISLSDSSLKIINSAWIKQYAALHTTYFNHNQFINAGDVLHPISLKDSIPIQTGNSGKVLGTNGISLLWVTGGGTTGINGLNGTDNIGLGGNLTANTTINLGPHQFTISDSTFNRLLQFSASGVTLGGGDATTGVGLFNGNTGQAEIEYVDFSTGFGQHINLEGFDINVFDGGGQIGFLYNSDYSTNGKKYNFWLPSWGAVKSRVDSAITASLGTSILNQNSTAQTGNFTLKGTGLFKDNVSTGRLLIAIDSSKILINQGGNVLTLNNNVSFQNGSGQTGLETTTGSSFTAPKRLSNVTVYSITYPNDTTGVSNTVISGNNPVLYATPLFTSASTTTHSGFTVNPGVAPTSPVNGNLWITASHIYAQIGGSTVQVDGGGGGGGTPANPTASAGVSPVNGVATTYMRSDAAPKVDSSAFTTRALLTTYQTKVQNIASYFSLSAGNTNTTNIATNTTNIALKANSLIPTALKTSAYTAVANDFVTTDASSSNVPITLTTAPANGTLIWIKMVNTASTNTTSVTAGGSDVFNSGGGVTSITLTGQNTSVQLQYNSGIWYVYGQGNSLAFLDLRYASIGTTINGKALSSNITLGLASSDFVNQGTTTGVLHGNAAGNPSFGSVVNADLANSAITLNGTSTALGGSFTVTKSNTDTTTTGFATRSLVATYLTKAQVIATYAPLLSPAFTTPSLGAATATSINGNTFTTGTYTLTGAASKTLTFNNTITLAGTDAQTYTFPTTSATIARTDAANIFTGHQTIEGVTSAGATGSVNIVFSNSPNITTPTINTSGTNNNISIATGSFPFAATASVNYQLNGSTNVLYRTGFYGNTSTTLAASNSFANIIMAGSAGATTTTSGTSAMLANLGIGGPTFVLGTGSTTTWATTVDIDGPASTSGAGTLTNPVLSLLVRSGNSLFNGNITLGTAGNRLFITEGSNAPMGQVALVSGTKAVTITGITTSSRAFVQLVTPSGSTSTVETQAVCTSNTLTIQANIAAGTINASDNSTYNYFIIN